MKIYVAFFLLTLIGLLLSCAPSSRYTTQTTTTPRSRYYRSTPVPERIPPSGVEYRSGQTFVWLSSFYGRDFHGRKTANGEIYDMYALTCAHRELPFGTLLKVTNPVNGKSVNVRVNDRGPFIQGRDLDLSKGAAEQLGMIERGIKELQIEIISIPE